MQSRFIVFTGTSLVLIAVIAFGTSRSISSSEEQNHQPQLLNRTPLFEVLKIDRDNDKVSLTLKNNYPQTVTAFVVSVGKNYQVKEEFAFAETLGDFGIQSEKTYRKTIPLPGSLQTETEIPIVIEAVVLADGTGDGSPLIYEDIVEERIGRAVQIRRSLRLLNQYLKTNHAVAINDLASDINNALDVSEANTVADIQELKPLGSIPHRSNTLISDHLNRGLEYGKEDIRRLLDEAKASQSPKETLLRMKMLYERIIARL